MLKATRRPTTWPHFAQMLVLAGAAHGLLGVWLVQSHWYQSKLSPMMFGAISLQATAEPIEAALASPLPAPVNTHQGAPEVQQAQELAVAPIDSPSLTIETPASSVVPAAPPQRAGKALERKVAAKSLGRRSKLGPEMREELPVQEIALSKESTPVTGAAEAAPAATISANKRAGWQQREILYRIAMRNRLQAKRNTTPIIENEM